MKQISGNKLLVKALKEEGVDTLFGYPGACTIDISDELYKHRPASFLRPSTTEAKSASPALGALHVGLMSAPVAINRIF